MKKSNQSEIPLIVDFDGTLIRTDSLHELLGIALSKPLILIRVFFILIFQGKAAMKDFLAINVSLDLALLPINQSVNDFIYSELKKGRKIEIVSGASHHLLNQAHNIWGDQIEVTGSTFGLNLTGVNKRKYLVSKYNEQGYDYIGNSTTDLPVWDSARKSYLATNSRPNSRNVKKLGKVTNFEQVFSDPHASKIRSWLRQIRIHQSVKNVLLFLPLLAAHEFLNLDDLLKVIVGFVCFSLVAFSVYILNDFVDLKSDRQHPRKRFRPMANGTIQPINGLIAGVAFFIVGITLGFTLELSFGMVLTLYALVTILYSLRIKKIAIFDVVTLALLYMIRIFAGSVLVHINLSFWFVGVTFFIFVSLALAKRYSELHSFSQVEVNQAIPGRGYSAADRLQVMSLGIASGVSSVLLMAIYIQTPGVKLLYPSFEFLWAAIPIYLYWVANLWLESGRGTVNEDPIIFAVKNLQSVVSAGLLFLIFVLAAQPETANVFKWLIG